MQFDHACLDLLSLAIWSGVLWLSVTLTLRKAQRWSKSVLTLIVVARTRWPVVITSTLSMGSTWYFAKYYESRLRAPKLWITQLMTQLRGFYVMYYSTSYLNIHWLVLRLKASITCWWDKLKKLHIKKQNHSQFAMQTIYSNAPENQDVTFPLQTKNIHQQRK